MKLYFDAFTFRFNHLFKKFLFIIIFFSDNYLLLSFFFWKDDFHIPLWSVTKDLIQLIIGRFEESAAFSPSTWWIGIRLFVVLGSNCWPCFIDAAQLMVNKLIILFFFLHGRVKLVNAFTRNCCWWAAAVTERRNRTWNNPILILTKTSTPSWNKRKKPQRSAAPLFLYLLHRAHLWGHYGIVTNVWTHLFWTINGWIGLVIVMLGSIRQLYWDPMQL